MYCLLAGLTLTPFPFHSHRNQHFTVINCEIQTKYLNGFLSPLNFFLLNCVAELKDRFASIKEVLGVGQEKTAQLDETCTNLEQKKMMLSQHLVNLGKR